MTLSKLSRTHNSCIRFIQDFVFLVFFFIHSQWFLLAGLVYHTIVKRPRMHSMHNFDFNYSFRSFGWVEAPREIDSESILCTEEYFVDWMISLWEDIREEWISSFHGSIYRTNRSVVLIFGLKLYRNAYVELNIFSPYIHMCALITSTKRTKLIGFYTLKEANNEQKKTKQKERKNSYCFRS